MILLKETHLLFQPMLFYRFLYCSLPFKIVFQMPMPVYRALEVLGSVMTTATLVYLHCLTVFTTGQKPDQRLQRHFPYAAVRKPDPKTTTTDCWVNRLIFFCSCHPCNISSSGKWIPAWNFAGNIFYNTHANMHASVYMCSQACAWECAVSTQTGIKFCGETTHPLKMKHYFFIPSHCLVPAQDCPLLPRDLPMVPQAKP